MSKQSKFLSLVLRHQPEIIHLTLDSAGWADVSELIKNMKIYGNSPTFSEIELSTLVENNSKKRFEFDVTGTKIRACQGHSLDVDLELTPVEPPTILFHGTNEVVWHVHARHEGLKPMSRDMVHLSADRATALTVARRREGTPAILEVLAHAMWENGHEFFQASNGVWLVKMVPREYIYRPMKKE